tara:strand:- start:1202 stop:1786 length:585 start_codon:yes stop_codon:yes gene_type:complete
MFGKMADSKPSVDETLHKNLKDLKEYVALATVNAKDYQNTNIKIIRHMIEEENIPGVYVTLNKPFKTLKKLLKNKKIDTRVVIFIDGVSKIAGGDIKKTEECLYIGSPENLSDIAVAMEQAVMAIQSENKFLFFDSLNTLLLYNKAITVAKFIHFLSTKMRTWKVKGIIVSLHKNKDKELIDELSQFCDVIMDM